MIWTKVHVVISHPTPMDQFYAVNTSNRGVAVKRVLREINPRWLEKLHTITATAESGPLERDEGLPLLKI